MTNYKSILVALGSADEHVQLLQKALAISSEDSAVHLIHIVEPFPYMDVSQGSALDINDQALAAAEKALNQLGNQFRINEEYLHIELGRPAAVIKQKAIDLQSDLIVVGRQDRHGVQRLLGSTANAVLHQARCDVLAIHLRHSDKAPLT